MSNVTNVPKILAKISDYVWPVCKGGIKINFQNFAGIVCLDFYSAVIRVQKHNA